MARYYYSAQPFLAWCLNHYFYTLNHYVWIGAPFYPFASNNPPSSTPYEIYGDLYKIFKKDDHNSKTLKGWRFDLKKGVDAQIKDVDLQDRLLKICDHISTVFFFPVVYRVDVDTLKSTKKVAGSGSEVNSNEYLVETLQESEFDVLFADFNHELMINAQISALFQGNASSDDVLEVFEANFHVPT